MPHPNNQKQSPWQNMTFERTHLSWLRICLYMHGSMSASLRFPFIFSVNISLRFQSFPCPTKPIISFSRKNTLKFFSFPLADFCVLGLRFLGSSGSILKAKDLINFPISNFPTKQIVESRLSLVKKQGKQEIASPAVKFQQLTMRTLGILVSV